mgnify:CR=1 FL=1
MRYVVGIDGGQSSTTAVVIDENGVLCARASAGPADHAVEPLSVERETIGHRGLAYVETAADGRSNRF